MIYLDLLIGFLEVGFFSFGGAYAAMALAHHWLSDEMLTYMIAISESTPGPIMVNMATYVGNSKGGLPGAIIATVAVVLPAFVIILLIMVLLRKLLQNKYVNAALEGLKACVIGIILAVGIWMIVKNCGLAAQMLNRHYSPCIFRIPESFEKRDHSYYADLPFGSSRGNCLWNIR